MGAEIAEKGITQGSAEGQSFVFSEKRPLHLCGSLRDVLLGDPCTLRDLFRRQFPKERAWSQIARFTALASRSWPLETPCAYRADIMVEDLVFVEVKAINAVLASHRRQVNT